MIGAIVDPSKFVRQLQTLAIKVRRKVVRRVCTDGGQEFTSVAKTYCPIRDTAAALKAAKVDIGAGSVVRRKEGQASFLQRNDKGRNVEIKYKGGLLRKAQGYKVKTYISGIAVAICGTRNGFKKQIGVQIRRGTVARIRRGSGTKNKTIREAGTPIIANPSKYAHLIIRGTKYIKANPYHSIATRSAAVRVEKSAMDNLAKATEEASRS
jgi:hypothetical protein